MQVNPDFLYAFQIGVGIGFVILTTFHFFPGKPWNIYNEDEQGDTVDGDEKTSQEQDSSAQKHEVSSAKSKLTRRKDWTRPSTWSPHQKLNFAVYLILVSVTLFILNFEYHDVVYHTMIQLFPKESYILGFKR